MTVKEAKDYIKQTDDLELIRRILLEYEPWINWVWVAKQIERRQNEL